MGDLISDEELIAEIRRLAYGDDPPTFEEMKKHGRYSSSPYLRHFGSWNAALAAAGFEPREEKNISPDALIAEIDRLADGDTPPTRREMDEYSRYSGRTCEARFGSWNDALRAAGYEPNRIYPGDLTREDLIGELQRLAVALDKEPSKADVKEYGRFTVRTYQGRFGSWSDAKIAAGVDRLGIAVMRGEIDPDDIPNGRLADGGGGDSDG